MVKRVLMVIDNLKIGGAERVFVDIVNLCEGHANFDVLLITDFEGETFDLPKNLNVINLHRKNKYNFFKMFQLRNVLKRYDLIHIHMRHTFYYLSIVKFLFALKNIFVFHDHYGKIGIDKSKPFKLAQFFKPNIYIGVCSDLCLWAVDIWKIKPERVFCFQNVPNLDLIERVQFNNSIKNGKMVMVGNIKFIKNQLFALKIAELMNVKIDFIGRNQDTAYFNRLKFELKDNLIIEDCIDVKTELNKYSFGIFTSLSESGPLVLLEYLLCGLPFVAYKTGGISVVLSKYFPDFFLDSFDQELWIQKINDIKLNPPYIDRALVLEIINNEFNRKIYLDRLMKIYEP